VDEYGMRRIRTSAASGRWVSIGEVLANTV